MFGVSLLDEGVEPEGHAQRGDDPDDDSADGEAIRQRSEQGTDGDGTTEGDEDEDETIHWASVSGGRYHNTGANAAVRRIAVQANADAGSWCRW
jgi:hypothetical protein